MEITTIIGYVGVFAAIIFGISFGSDGFNFATLSNFINGASIFITIGGTCLVLLSSFPLKYFKNVPKHFRMIFKKDKKNPFEYVEILTELSKEARRKGLLALEDKAKDFKDEFLKESVLLIVDAIEPDKLRVWFDQKLSYIEKRDEEERKLYDLGAAIGPAFGMIGTLIGLVNMLKSMSLEGGAGNLGADMSVALITTFYGSVLANCIFIPISNKLEIAQESEILIKEIIIEGVVCIKEGENPKYIREKLLNFLDEKQTQKVTGENGKKVKVKSKAKVKVKKEAGLENE
ncbi:MAG: motility protein A [Acetobacterium sp.]